jgi:hypothetical protein
MTRYRVFSGYTLIGHSELECGDPPQSIASGRFFPLASYSAVQVPCIAARRLPQEHLDLSVIRPNGERLPAHLGVFIADYSGELGEIEVYVLGVGYPLYEELFPHHVAAYRKQFGQAP